jgi:AcrR family transcriptional regulator
MPTTSLKPRAKTPAKPAAKKTTRGGRKPAASRAAGAAGNGVIAMRDEVNAYKKELILRAAIDTFYDYGYHETTVDMLAERLDGTKAIFYYYYPDKRAVLEEIYRRSLSSAQAVIQHALDAGGTPSQMLETFARRYTEWVIDNQRLVGVFWSEERTLSPEVRAEVAAEQKKFDDLLANLIKEGVAAGEFKVEDTQTMARAILGLLSFVYTWWRPDHRLSREEVARKFAALALRMARYGADPAPASGPSTAAVASR